MISFLIVVSVTGGLIVLLAWLALLLLRAYADIRWLRAHGIKRRAQIQAARAVGHGKLRVTLSMLNEANTPVREDLDVVDTRPHLRRFNSGKALDVLLSPEPRRRPRVILADAQAHLGWKAVVVPTLLVMLLAGGYRIFMLRLYQAGGELGEMFSRGQPEFVLALVWGIPVMIGLIGLAMSHRNRKG